MEPEAATSEHHEEPASTAAPAGPAPHARGLRFRRGSGHATAPAGGVPLVGVVEMEGDADAPKKDKPARSRRSRGGGSRRGGRSKAKPASEEPASES